MDPLEAAQGRHGSAYSPVVESVESFMGRVARSVAYH
jgi:hypothetical protein